MRRLLTAFALSLVCLSLIPLAHADTSAVSQASPVYLDYMPFGYETLIATSRGFLVGPLHQAIHVGLDKGHVKDAEGGIMQLTTPAAIQSLRTLLKDPQCPILAQGSGNMRFLFEADGGKTQIFVDTDGVVSQGNRSWRLTSRDFTRLARTLGRIYAAPVSK